MTLKKIILLTTALLCLPFPDGEAATSKAYVTNNNSASVSVIDIGTDTVIIQTLTVGVDPTAIAITPQAELVVFGEAKKDQFLTQTDLYNQIRWEAPENTTPSSYEIFRDGELIATLPGNQTVYLDHNRNKNETSTYLVVALVGQATVAEGTIAISQ